MENFRQANILALAMLVLFANYVPSAIAQEEDAKINANDCVCKEGANTEPEDAKAEANAGCACKTEPEEERILDAQKAGAEAEVDGEKEGLEAEVEAEIDPLDFKGKPNGTDDLNQPQSIAERARNYLQFKIGYAIQRYYLPAIAPVGFVGNTLSFIVMYQKHNRRVSCCVYMMALAISDNAMIFPMGYLWAMAEHAERNWAVHECKFVCFCLGTFGLVGVYLILFMTFDRWIAVNFPFKASTWCTVQRARITCIGVFVACAVYEIPHYIYAGVVPGTRQCAPFTYSSPYVVGYTMLNLTMNAFLPFILMFIMNGMIIKTVLGRQAFGGDEKQNKQEAKKQAQARQLVAMLLLISFALMILTFPQYIRYVIYRFVNQKATPAHFATYVLYFNLSTKMLYTNNAVNFFLYCAGGSRFRHDLKVVITCGMVKGLSFTSSKAATSSQGSSANPGSQSTVATKVAP